MSLASAAAEYNKSRAGLNHLATDGDKHFVVDSAAAFDYIPRFDLKYRKFAKLRTEN